jgi:predicted TIM-barrel fold metal-dependent hydrolase
MSTIHGITHTPPDFAVPPGACDCHTHVFGPAKRYPLSDQRVYTPDDASIASLLALQQALKMDRVVIVHPSPYGADNRCSVDAVRQLGSRARGVMVIDADTSDRELQEMHAAGVRGVRVNLETGGVHDPGQAGALLRQAAARVAPLGWHVQTYTTLAVIAALADTIAALPVTLVIDHFGRAEAARGIAQPGFAALLGLVASGKAYVKLSAPHRLGTTPDDGATAELARALIAANPERMLWASDWPHPNGQKRGVKDRDAIEPFAPIDDGRALNRFAGWAGSAEMIRRILVDNPARLYDFETEAT